MAINFSGTWHNQYPSEMTLQVDANGNVTGKYKTAVGSVDPAAEFEIKGYVYEDQISFIVRWKNATADAGSITAWVGQLTKVSGTDVIRTMWHLTENVPDAEEPTKLWSSITTGADYFWRGPAPQPFTPPIPIIAAKKSHASKKHTAN